MDLNPIAGEFARPSVINYIAQFLSNVLNLTNQHTNTMQIFEILHIVEPYSVLSVLRSPRPLILIRFIRVFLKFSMPKSRIKQIFKRSSQQIYNVSYNYSTVTTSILEHSEVQQHHADTCLLALLPINLFR